jgi:hypothetical protein
MDSNYRLMTEPTLALHFDEVQDIVPHQQLQLLPNYMIFLDVSFHLLNVRGLHVLNLVWIDEKCDNMKRGSNNELRNAPSSPC